MPENPKSPRRETRMEIRVKKGF
ncbi:rCG39833 [Rattus norvegicus]|uniref:RCG39833 n=1 Tax=Rattus norvegicus TaxID=10116 RepID=A6I868_RAT|nr:rCG39833 [Rattus norvegicus]